MHLAVYDAEGRLRIELRREKQKQVELPKAHGDPGDPKRMSADGLYHAGEWLDKYRRTEEALRYYREALAADPHDSRVNLEMAFLALKQGCWKAALEHLDAVHERDASQARIYRPRHRGGLALGDLTAARDHFSRASYSVTLFPAAYHNLARLNVRRGDFQAALAKLDEAAGRNGKLADLPALRAAALRRLGRHAAASAAAQQAIELDPMHFMAGYEKLLALQNTGQTPADWRQTWNSLMRDEVQNYLELAVTYSNAGLLDDADAVLAVFSAGKETGRSIRWSTISAAISGSWPAMRHGREYYAQAAGAWSPTNPHRLEEAAALEAALHRHPEDAHAHLFLGNLLYGLGRGEEAIVHWKAAVQRDNCLAFAWRNLGLAESSRGDRRRRWPAMRRASRPIPAIPSCSSSTIRRRKRRRFPRPSGSPFSNSAYDLVQTRDDLVARIVDLRLAAGSTEDLKQARRELPSTISTPGKASMVSTTAGGRSTRDSATRRSRPATSMPPWISTRRPASIRRTWRWPPPPPTSCADLYWNLAKTCTALKKPAAAQDYLRKIVAETYTKPHLGTYYQALAQKAMGRAAQYQSLLDQLEKRARGLARSQGPQRGKPETVGCYLLWLALKERGDPQAAELRKSLDNQPQAVRFAVQESAIRRRTRL